MSTLGDTEHLSGSLLRTSKAAAWLSLASACAAWAFDAMDLQIFTLVLFPLSRRRAALSSLVSWWLWAWAASHSALPRIESDARGR